MMTANNLSEGNHVITLTVTDFGGLSASESVNIRVVRQVPPGTTDLAISVNGPSGEVSVGQQVSYDINVLNNGPDPATGVIVTDGIMATRIDEVVSSVSAASSQGSCTVTAGKVKCNLGDLVSNALATVKITEIPASVGITTDLVRAYGDQADPQMRNNETTYPITIVDAVNIPPISTVGPAQSVFIGSFGYIEWQRQ